MKETQRVLLLQGNNAVYVPVQEKDFVLTFSENPPVCLKGCLLVIKPCNKTIICVCVGSGGGGGGCNDLKEYDLCYCLVFQLWYTLNANFK